MKDNYPIIQDHDLPGTYIADYQVQNDLHLFSSPGFPLTPSVISVTPPSVDLG